MYSYGQIALNSTIPDSASVCQQNKNFSLTFLTNQSFTLFLNAEVIDASTIPPGNSVSIPNPPCSNSSTNSVNPIDLTVINITATSGAGVVTGPTLNQNTYEFAVNVPTDAQGIPILQEITIDYAFFLDCSIIPNTITGNNIPQLYFTQNWSNNGGQSTVMAPQPNSVPVYYPHIYQTNSYINVPANYGQQVELIHSYENNGSSDVLIDFLFEDLYVLNCAIPAYTIDSILIGTAPFGSLPASYIPYSPSPIFDTVTLAQNEILFIKQIITIDNCIDNCNTLREVKFNWKCANAIQQPPISCDVCQESYITAFGFQSEQPSFIVERMLPSYQGALYDTSCAGDFVDWKFKIKNTSEFTELDFIKINFGNGAYLNSLSLIDSADISFNNANCDGCNVNLNTTSGANTPCSGFLTNPVQSFEFEVEDLIAQDSILIEFRTYRCCTDDPSLFNSPKYYNQWGYAAIAERRECPQPITNFGATPTTDPFVNGTINGDGNISGNGIVIGQDIDLGLSFGPLTTDMFVPRDSVFGVQKEHFQIQMIQNPSFVGTVHDLQVLGTNSTNSSITGMLKVEVRCERGLLIDDLINDVSFEYIDPLGTLKVWEPQYIYNQFGDTRTCEENNFIYYFNLDSTSFPLGFLTEGVFNFSLLACCNETAEPVDYKVLFSILPNTACFNISEDTSAVDGVNCSSTNAQGNCCWLPLSSTGFHISVHCPGCKAPGIIVDNYYMQRTSLGYEDKNNNKFADNTNIIDPDNYLDSLGNPILINTNTSVFGDTIEDRLVAHFADGDPTDSIPGYSYAEMTALGMNLGYVQLLTNIPHSQKSDMNLNILGYDLYIDAKDSTATGPCEDCDDFEGAKGLANGYHTLLKVSVIPNGGITPFLERQNESFLYTFSEDEFFNPTNTAVNYATYSGNDTFSGFEPDQQYRLVVRYGVCGNTRGSLIYNPDPSDISLTSEINTWMWLIGDSVSYSTFNTVQGQMPNTKDTLAKHPWYLAFDTTGSAGTLSLVDQNNLANAFFFFCETNGAVHYFASTDIINETIYGSATGGTACEVLIQIRGRNSIGNNDKEIFPYEFKSPNIIADTFEIEIPQGYHISTSHQAEIFTRYFNGSSLQNTDKLEFDLNSLAPHCSTCPSMDTCAIRLAVADIISSVDIVNNTTTGTNCAFEFLLPLANNTSLDLLLGDEMHEILLVLYFEPCACEPVSHSFPKKDSKITFIENPYCDANTMLACDSLILPVSQINMAANGAWGIPVPNLNIAFLAAQINAATNIITWNFQITNNSITGTSVNAAPNVYLNLPSVTSTPSLPFLVNWSVHNLVVNNNPANFSQVNDSVFIISDLLNVGSILTGQLQVEYSLCEDTVSFDIGWGYNCDTNFAQMPFCQDSTETLTIIDEAVEFVVETNNSVYPNQFNMCDTHTMSACFKNIKKGNVKPLQVLLSSYDPTIITIDTVKIKNCYSNVNSNTVVLNTPYLITASDISQILDTNGVDTTYLAINECICVEVAFTVNCTADSLQLPDIALFSESFCGDTLVPSPLANFPKIAWSGITKCTDCYSITKTASVDTIYPYKDFNYSITVLAFNTGNSSVTLFDTLPTSFIQTTTSQTFPTTLQMPPVGPANTTVVGHLTSTGTICNTAYIATPSGLLKDSACVFVNSQCQGLAQYSFTDTIRVSDIDFQALVTSSPPSTVENKILSISGTLLIDLDATFKGCELIMEPGSNIIVQANQSLDIDSSLIYACSDMWEGIILEATASIRVHDTSSIKHANTAIYCFQPNYIDVYDSEILDCVSGVYTKPVPGISKTNLFITGSKIGLVQGNTLRPDYAGQPAHGALPKVGIELNNMITTIGGNGNRNEFFNMNNGVVAHVGITTVKNSAFNNIQIDPAYQQRYDGTAVVADPLSASDNALRFINSLKVLPDAGLFNTVENSFRGIYTNGAVLTANNVSLINVARGIYGTQTPPHQNTTVLYSTIEASRNGIVWEDNKYAKSMLAHNNIIAISTVPPTGPPIKGNAYGAIYMSEFSNIYPVIYSAIGNTVELINGRYGIWAFNLNGAKIMHDSIVINESPSASLKSVGLYLIGTKNSSVTCNKINGAYQLGWPAESIAMRTSLSEANYIACNYANKVNTGFYFGGQCYSTRFKGNEMDTSGQGLYLNTLAIIDPQPHFGNNWNGPFGSIGAYHASNDQQVIGASEFLIDSLDGPNLWTNPNVNGWFRPISGNTFFCNSNYVCTSPPGTGPSQNDTIILRLIAEGEFEPEIYMEENIAMAENYLYEQLITDSKAWQNDSLYLAFMQKNQGTETEDVYEIIYNMELAFNYDSVFSGLIEMAFNQLQVFEDSVNTIDEQFEQGTFTGNYELMREQLIYNIGFTNQTIENLYITQNAAASGYLNTAELINDYMVSAEIPNINTEAVNDVEYEILDNNYIAIQTEYSNLLSIAQQCPYSGGRAVYRARAILSLVNDSILYNDDAICLSQGIYRKQNTATENQISIYPNPAQTSITIKLNEHANANCTLHITNTLGKKVLGSQLNCNVSVHEYDISHIQPGIYFITIEGADNYLLTAKLTIIR